MKATAVLGLSAALLVIVLVLLRGGTSMPAGTQSGARSAAAEPVEAPRSSLRRSAPCHPLSSGAGGVLLPGDPLSAVEAETDPDRRSDALEVAVEAVSPAEFRGTLEAALGRDTPAAAEFRKLLLRRWAEADAPAAAAWAAQLPPGSDQPAALEQVAIAWGDQDPNAAAVWLQGLPAGDGKQAATLALAYEATRTDPISALDTGAGLPASAERDALLVHAASEWASRDATAAAAWAQAVTEPDLRNQLLAGIAVASAKQDSAAAATLAATALPAGSAQDNAVVSIVQRWAESEPEAAGAWVAQFPATPARQTAAENLLSIWMPSDPQGAATWLSNQSDDFWLQASGTSWRLGLSTPLASPAP